ncbi:sugar phosphate isomerase/epimerase family protein [Gayadomonas joobiniege]|uniref:sugar phosphate isomerase/epimerase family protein n=1 Tax=Gayadomonas joobiniege TaxID=1234606 RepID=UPI00037B4B76|nr:sugar phosphate isomerase/epimerase [Gayadomonas joobiniege]
MKFLQSSLMAAVFIFLQACSNADESGNEQSHTPSLDVPPISVQLWSVRHAVKADFEGSLREIAKMGFDGVEFAGDYGPYANDPAGLKAFLDSIGLQASGAHIATKILTGPERQKTLDFLKTLGIDLIMIPMDSRAFNPDKIDAFSELLTRLTAELKAQGFILSYHNHAQEFADFNGATFWDYLAKNTPEDMGLQLDVGWVNFAGKDPISYVKRYPNRTLATHIKVRSPNNNAKNVIIGQDNFDWAELVKADVKYGGTRWLVIEQEEYPEGMTPMQSIKASRDGFVAQLKRL